MPLLWRKIESRLLLPSFVEDLNDTLGPDPATWYVLEGYRSNERSDELYAAYIAGTGPKAAPGGSSAHNFGLAIDLVLDGDPDKDGLQPDWIERHPDWIRLRSLIDAHPRLHGGWWFGDGDHIERTQWQNLRQWRSFLPHSV